MATIVTTIKKLIGTAAQRAAMSADDRNATPAGSTFFETDTGFLYVLNNATPRAWVLKRSTIQVTGNDLDLRGLAINRPAAGAVEVGATYWAVDTGDIHVSDGTNWVVV